MTQPSLVSTQNENTTKSESPEEIFTESDKLGVWEIPVIQLFTLVNWPDTCQIVPTYEQLLDTLEIVHGYKQNPEEYGEENKAAIEEWLKKNSITKFKKALDEAEEEQERLLKIKSDWFRDNKLFPQSYMRGDN